VSVLSSQSLLARLFLLRKKAAQKSRVYSSPRFRGYWTRVMRVLDLSFSRPDVLPERRKRPASRLRSSPDAAEIQRSDAPAKALATQYGARPPHATRSAKTGVACASAGCDM
jgi:hypothetical protein